MNNPEIRATLSTRHRTKTNKTKTTVPVSVCKKSIFTNLWNMF